MDITDHDFGVVHGNGWERINDVLDIVVVQLLDEGYPAEQIACLLYGQAYSLDEGVASTSEGKDWVLIDRGEDEDDQAVYIDPTPENLELFGAIGQFGRDLQARGHTCHAVSKALRVSADLMLMQSPEEVASA